MFTRFVAGFKMAWLAAYDHLEDIEVELEDEYCALGLIKRRQGRE